MKKILIILPLSLCMSYAWSQTENKKEIQTETVLDGKSFKITLMSADMTDRKSGSTLNETTSGSEINSTDRSKTNDPTKDGNGNRTSGGSSTTSPVHSGDMKTDNVGNDDMGKVQEGKENVQIGYENKTMFIRFEGGSIKSAFLTSNKVEFCPYTMTSNGTAMISFKATCKRNSDDSSKSTYTWSGTVENKMISGFFNKMNDDGKIISYTFTGSETNEKDDIKDLGVK